jgi:hypothetical protein
MVTDAQMIAKLIDGEIGSGSLVEKEQVAWTVLNRLDDERFPDTIAEVITAPGQFQGYRVGNEITDENMNVALSVLIAHKTGGARSLPEGYLYFSGDGKHNYFKQG